jgi:hypothetical protein
MAKNPLIVDEYDSLEPSAQQLARQQRGQVQPKRILKKLDDVDFEAVYDQDKLVIHPFKVSGQSESISGPSPKDHVDGLFAQED